MPHKNPEDRRRYIEEWKKRNQDKIKQYEKTRYAKHKEKRSAALKEWNKNNPERVKEIQKNWTERNKGKVNAKQSRRRARLLAATPEWLTEEDKTKILCLYQVAAMLTEHGNEPHHVDHIVPLNGQTVCGLHVPWNLRVIPAIQNMRKGNRLWQ